jgi:RTX calcium-binding nonapeptide repeat (4 copies)
MMVHKVLTISALLLLLCSGVALAATINCSSSCTGTRFADTIIGSDRRNTIDGKPGNDYVEGKGGSDKLLGNRDNDEIHGGAGPDELRGGKHSDTDLLYGDAGDDTLNAVDEFSPGATDYLYCGDGTDTAYVDGWTEVRPDVVVDCEVVIPSVCQDVYPEHLCPTAALSLRD